MYIRRVLTPHFPAYRQRRRGVKGAKEKERKEEVMGGEGGQEDTASKLIGRTIAGNMRWRARRARRWRQRQSQGMTSALKGHHGIYHYLPTNIAPKNAPRCISTSMTIIPGNIRKKRVSTSSNYLLEPQSPQPFPRCASPS